MQLSKRMLEMVKFFEGCHLTAYWDKYGGVWTIGYGHTGPDVYEGLTITQERADELFNQDMQSFKNFVSKIPLEFNENEFSALVSFSFNVGTAWLHNSETGKLLLANNRKGFANRILLYNRGNTGPLLGLYRRRLAERALFLYGVSHYYQEIKSIPNDVINNIPQPDPPKDERPDLGGSGGGGGGVKPPDPPKPPSGDVDNYRLKNRYIFGSSDPLFGRKFTSTYNEFKLVKIIGDMAIIEDGSKRKFNVHKNNLIKM